MKFKITHVLLLIIVSFCAVAVCRYKQYITEGNFLLTTNASCTPSTEKCFKESADLGFISGPYKKVEILKRYAPKCLEEHNCDKFNCENIPENSCKIAYCSEDTKADGEQCYQ